MEYGKLGNTDIEVSKLCVGCMSFGKAGTMHDWTLDEAESENVIKHALDLGYNFFDTANGYSAGTSEEYLGKALKKNVARNQVVIASKVYFNEGRLSRQAIMREIDGTLSRLGTDYLDLYIIHRFDYDIPIEETMEALHDLVKAGKVRALGASAMYGYQFYNMQLAARDNGWTPFSAMENHYNLLYREDERELLPICKQMKVSLMPYSPLAAGHQGSRTDLTLEQNVPKFKRTTEAIADGTGESSKQIQRYIRLTELIPELLDLVDNKKLQFTVAVDISYIDKEVQEWIYEYISDTGFIKPKQIAALRNQLNDGPINQIQMLSIFNNCVMAKKVSRSLTFSEKKLTKYFPDDYTAKDMEQVIESLLEKWMQEQSC